jgi:phospholipid/cholesterol/gamma-HCH transport system substrate-binding protein
LEAKTNYTLVGLIVLVLTGAMIATGLWLSVGFDKKEYVEYVVFIHEAVSGLNEEAPVKYSGVQVGYVSKIRLNHEDPQLVEIILNIEKGTPITTSTYATLLSQGITGVSYVGLSASSSDLTPLEKLPGEPYPVIPAKPSLFNQLDKAIKDVSDNVNSVAIEIQRIFDKKNASYISKTLANMQTFSDVIAQNSKQIDQSLKSADTMLTNLAQVSKDLPSVMQDLKVGVKQFNRMANSVTDAGKEVSGTMRSGKATIEQISQQTLPPAVVLMRRLDSIAANLEKVSNMMRQNPAVVVWGSKPPAPGPGE